MILRRHEMQVQNAATIGWVCADIGADESNLVTVPQMEMEGRQMDTVDRMQVGAGIVRRLVDGGKP